MPGILWWGLTALLLTSLALNASLHHKLRLERNKPAPEPRVIVETRVVEKPVPVAINHVESRGLGGRNLGRADDIAGRDFPYNTEGW